MHLLEACQEDAWFSAFSCSTGRETTMNQKRDQIWNLSPASDPFCLSKRNPTESSLFSFYFSLKFCSFDSHSSYSAATQVFVLSVRLFAAGNPILGSGYHQSNLCSFAQGSAFYEKIPDYFCREKGKNSTDMSWRLSDRKWKSKNKGMWGRIRNEFDWSLSHGYLFKLLPDLTVKHLRREDAVSKESILFPLMCRHVMPFSWQNGI